MFSFNFNSGSAYILLVICKPILKVATRCTEVRTPGALQSLFGREHTAGEVDKPGTWHDDTTLSLF